MVKKFSQFTQQGTPRVGASFVGLWAGNNAQFDFPGQGVGDATGQFLLKWISGGIGATNYIQVTTGLSGDPAMISVDGGDANVDLLINSKADGDITLTPPQAGNINLSLGGAGNINLGTNAGKIVINSTTGINAILDEDNMASNSNTAVPTQQSVKAYVDGQTTPILNQTFITNTDETSTLPNSNQLLGTANQITATDGVLSFPNMVIFPGSVEVDTNLALSSNQISTASGDLTITPFANLNLYGQGDVTVLSGVSGGAGDLSLIVNGTGAFAVETGVGNITFDTDSGIYDFGISSSSVMDLTGSGFRLGATGARITSISADGTLGANSDTLVVTEKATKTYIDASSTALKSYSYITKTDNTANLPGSTPLSGLGSGFLSNTTTTGVLSPRTMTGTASQIDITNGTGVSGNPTSALSSTIVTPGTLNVGTTFTVGSTVSVDSISNSAAASSATGLMTSNAVQLAIAAAISSAKSFRGGYDASTNLFPATGGSGVAGAIQAGDVWEVTVPGILGGTSVYVGNTLLALTNLPGQTAGNWAINVNGVASIFGRMGIVTAQSGDYSFSLISGTAAVAQGGTGATSVGSTGTLAQSTGSAWGSTTATYPSTIAVNSILYASASNVISGLSPVGSSVLVTSASGIPFLPPAMTNGQIIIGSTLDVPLPGNITPGTGIAVTNGSHSITIGLSTPVSAANGGTGNTSGQAASVANAATFNNAGSGAASGSTFDGSVARTISYNTVGASPVAGSSSIVTVGTITSGTWQGTAVGVTKGGTGLTSTTINQILYSSATSTIAGLATANRAMLVTGATGVPAMTASMTNGQIVIGSSSGAAAPAALGVGPNLTTAVGANSLTINTNFSYGYIWMNTGNWTGISFSALTTYSELSGLTTAYVLASPVQDFSMTTNGQLQYIGTASKTLLVSANVGFNPVSSGYAIQLFKNGIALAGSECYETGPTSLAVIDFPVTVVTNDYISIFLKRSTAGTAPITQIALSIGSIA